MAGSREARQRYVAGVVVAGVGRMERRHFFVWSGVGAVLWATGVTVLGYFLGGIAFIHDHLESAILLIVAISVLPMVVEVIRHRRAASMRARSSSLLWLWKIAYRRSPSVSSVLRGTLPSSHAA